jgi:4-amino-4-deoxy-L-arabinose transferase-like glycosyltransferase
MSSPAPKAKHGRTSSIAAVVILVLFLTLSLSSLFTARPQTDEGACANPAYNLIYNGAMGTSFFGHSSPAEVSISRHTYWQPPLYFVILAIWYKIVGFGLVQTRLLSLLFGLVAIFSWFIIGRSISGSAVLGCMAAGLVSVDYFFVLGASQGRMDMMCAGFGTSAIAAYLALRQQSLKSALFWSHVLFTMAILTHPVGLGYWLGTVPLILYFDRRSLSFKLVLIAAVPCLIGAAAWGMYIAQDPSAFEAQMHGNLEQNKQAFQTSGSSSIRIVRNLEQEVLHRYIAPFGLGAGVGLANRLKSIVLLAYLVGVAGTLILVRRHRNLLVFPVPLIILFFYIAFVSPSKFSYYLPHTTMFMAGCLAAFLFYLNWPSPERKRLVVSVVLLVIASVQAAGLLYRIRQNPYGASFLPAVASITRNSPSGSLIFGSCELWFLLQPQRPVLHDWTLGFHRGLKPAVFVMDPLYRDLHERDRRENAAVYDHVERYLNTSRLVYQDGYYQVYEAQTAQGK